jgi:anti-sigma factor ChrR (cupin superfamily)
MKITRLKERSWVATGLEGIQSCQTFAGENGDGGYFAEFKAGSLFPRHSHEGWEQILVVSGKIRFDGVELESGDVLQVQKGDQHEALSVTDTVLFVAHRGGTKFEK